MLYGWIRSKSLQTSGTFMPFNTHNSVHLTLVSLCVSCLIGPCAATDSQQSLILLARVEYRIDTGSSWLRLGPRMWSAISSIWVVTLISHFLLEMLEAASHCFLGNFWWWCDNFSNGYWNFTHNFPWFFDLGHHTLFCLFVCGFLVRYLLICVGCFRFRLPL